MTAQMIRMSDGARIAVYEDGSPLCPALLLSNSLGTDHTMWSVQTNQLSHKYRIIRYDTRGHGKSDAPAGSYSIDRLSLDVIEILDHLEIDMVHFCGVSLGGMTGQQLSWRMPKRFRSMTLSTTSAYMGPPQNWQARIEKVKQSGMNSILDQVLSTWFTEKFRMDFPDKLGSLKRVFSRTNSDGYVGCCAAIRDMDQRKSATLNMLPSLIVCGSHDKATPKEHADFLHRAMPKSSLVTLDGAHLINIEQPDAFTAALSEFLAQVAG